MADWGACCCSDVLDTSLASPLVRRCCLLRDSPFLKECLFKGRNLLYQIIYLVQESVVIIPQLLDLLLQ